jgi:malic enzyme
MIITPFVPSSSINNTICLTLEEDVLNLRRILNGKLEVQNRIPIENTSEEQRGKETLRLIYTPGVAFAAKK